MNDDQADDAVDRVAGSDDTGDRDGRGSAPPRRPTIEKVKVDRDIIIPDGHEWGEQLAWTQRAFYRFVWFVVQLIGRTYFRLKVIGTHNLPTSGPFIVSPIHRSNLDTPILAAITWRRLRYMGKESLWKSSFGAWFLTTLGGFPVDRATADREALRACIEVIERGEPLVMFPEGTRQSGPTIHELFDGPAYVASRCQVPIIPVGIGGSERALGKGMKFPKPSKITLVVGAPLTPPAPGPNGRVPRKAIKAFTEQLGVEIQRLFDEAERLAR
jgi:1-acyl-sn-glycerol-3-phosphate acyltransferase